MYHTHNYSGKTSFNAGHNHEYGGETSEALSGVPHFHNIVGYTEYDGGHRHYYSIQTSFDYPAPGGHFHYISGTTYITEEHYHMMKDRTSIV